MTDIEKMVAQLDELLINSVESTEHTGWAFEARGQGKPLMFCNRLDAAIERMTMPGSSYMTQLNNARSLPQPSKLQEIHAIARALRDDLKAGWVDSVVELVHANTYSDYLEMADELLAKGYKDPAAVITGTTLEVHVRALCVKHGVDTERPDGSPKKADVMNAELKKAGVYDTLRQKQLTAWMDLRNKAAHGDYQTYNEADVRSFIQGVRDFMLRYPA